MALNGTRPHSGGPLCGAVIGYGFIGAYGHLAAYRERAARTGDVKIVAIADICAARRRAAAEAFPEVRVYDDYQSLLAAEGASLDFVDICTPPCDHATIAQAALKRGLHVLCEKPLTTTLDQASLLLDHARRAERVIFPCHNYKHAPVVKAIGEILASGRIGRVRSVTLNTMRNTHAKGVTEWNTDWRRQRHLSGGGVAMDHGSHSFYLTFDWMNAYPTAVTASMGNLTPDRFDTEDHISVGLTFPRGFATAQLSWTAGVRKVLYSIQGENGAITVDDDDLELSIMMPTDGPDIGKGAVAWDVERRSISSHWGDASHHTWFNALFDQFLEAIVNHEYVGKEALDAHRCIEVITAAYRSAAEGCRLIALPHAPALHHVSPAVAASNGASTNGSGTNGTGSHRVVAR